MIYVIIIHYGGESMKDENSVLSIDELRQAIGEEQLVIYLQPKCNLSTGKNCGAEALVRWEHPTKGTIMAQDFIPEFEDNNLIKELDMYVWEKSCQMISNWLREGKAVYPISVNVSDKSLFDRSLVDSLMNLLSKYGLAANSLQLEITELTYLKNPRKANRVINSLHEAGFTIVLDDFGSGYSALATLKQIHVDALKVDMRYLSIEDKKENDEIILVSLIKMVNWLGMTVIAETVENRTQRDILEGAGCDIVQGYYYCEPLSVNEYEKKTSAEVEELKDKNEYEEPQKSSMNPKYNATILIVDDDPVSRDILREIFQDTYFVHTSASGEEGMEYLINNAGRIRLVLIDNFMPGMSGLDFLRACKQNSMINMIPQIMITVSDSEEDQVRAFAEGAYDYITKPFVKEIVQARVSHVMEISCKTSIFDVVEQKYQQAPELDGMTKLLNKITFHELATRVLDTLPDEQHALLLIDIDNFKNVNDQHGHLMGDKIIRCVADELAGIFRKTDLIGRFGGDEFVVLLSKLKTKNMVKIKAYEIIKVVLLSCVKRFNISTSLSVGVAFSENNDTIDSLFEKADHALYEAKSSGKGKAVVFGEKVPPVIDDNKPVVLVCTKEAQVYSTIALTYGKDAAFVMTSSLFSIKEAFSKYRERIRVVCFDMMDEISITRNDERYKYALAQSENETVKFLAICKEGDMHGVKCSLELKVSDILLLPPPIGVIERILSRTIMEATIISDKNIL